jgi:hypothetical protein
MLGHSNVQLAVGGRTTSGCEPAVAGQGATHGHVFGRVGLHRNVQPLRMPAACRTGSNRDAGEQNSRISAVNIRSLHRTSPATARLLPPPTAPWSIAAMAAAEPRRHSGVGIHEHQPLARRGIGAALRAAAMCR